MSRHYSHSKSRKGAVPTQRSMMSQSGTICGVVKASTLAGLILGACSFASGQDAFRFWGAEFDTQVGGGFDSNINGTRDGGTKDGFLTASQSMIFSRQKSLTLLNFKGNVSKTQFFDNSEADFVDGGVELNAAYPEEVDNVTYWKASGFWNRLTHVDLDAGRRIQPAVYGARASGEWLFSPKTGFTGSVRGVTTDRSRDGLSTTRALSLRTGFSHAWRPERRWSAEYGLTLGESDSGAGTDSTHHIIGVRRRGTISPKVSGDAMIGVRSSDFTGANDFSDTGPIVSADLLWAASPQLTARLGIESDYDFTANGSAVVDSVATFNVKRELGNGLRFGATLGRGYSSYKGQSRLADRSDRYWRLGGELEYSFTQRFFVRLSGDLIDSESNIVGNDLNRGIVSLFSGWRY